MQIPSSEWFIKYLGRPYIQTSYDCAEFVRDVYKKEFDFDAPITSEKSLSEARHTELIELGMKTQVDEVPIDEAREGDLLVMRVGRFKHLGILCFANGVLSVVHNSRVYGGVVCQRVAQLSRLDSPFKLVGAYRFDQNNL